MTKDKNFNTLTTLDFGQKLLDLSTPKVMGILNLTDDSFYDGGRFNTEKQALLQVEKMLEDGADVIDLGGYSSRPNAPHVSLDSEWKRLEGTLKKIAQQFANIIISVDTFRSEIAKRAIDNGADLINDISAGELDANMFSTIAQLNVPYIMMHMQGTPQNMQKNPHYKHVSLDIYRYFEKKIKEANQLGINQLVIDPGFGFGKNLNHNYQILNRLEDFHQLNLPIMVGVSRKSMIHKVLETNAQNALNGTTFIHGICLQKGASILRVHDVKEAKECIKLFNFAKINS